MTTRVLARVIEMIFYMIASTLTMRGIKPIMIRPLSFVHGCKGLLLVAYADL